MVSRIVALIVCFLVAVPVAQANNPPEKGKTNIILIMADDLGAECIGCYGCTQYKTPNLDALAKTGVRFAHAYSQPLCTPTRVQIMSGKYNHRNYIGFGKMRPNEYTFANLLKAAGYSTCIVGKWQLGGDYDQPSRYGFDEYCLWQIQGRDQRYWDPRIVVNKKLRPDLAKKYGPDVYTDHLLDFVERHKDGPFFVYFPMCLTHSPFVSTPDSKKLVPNEKTKNKAYFADMMNYTDKIVGRITDKLDDLKIRENTLVIFTGDNGTDRAITTQTVNGPVRGGKSFMTNTGTHVPMIVTWSGTAAKGKVCSDLVDFTDFLPTFADVAGVPLPKDRKFDGQSFLPQIRGEKGNPREWIFCHYWGYGRKKKQAREFARNQRWKLYHDGKFFDLDNDPQEKTPLKKLSPEAQAARTLLEPVFAKVGSALK